MWGCSSAGRALPSQGRGREFKSLHLHHHDDQRSDNIRPLFLFSPFRAFFPPCPLGERYPHGSSTNSIWPPSALYQKKQRFLPADVRAQKKRRGECPTAPRFASSSAILEPTPGPNGFSMAEVIRSRRSLCPCRKSGRCVFPAPCPPTLIFQPSCTGDGHFPRISPTCPPSFCDLRTAPGLPETPRSEHFRFIESPLKTNFPC